MPIARAVFRPKCWSGKNSTRLRRSKAQSSTARALADVQTMPPCRPQNAFRSAAELTYVIGIRSAVSITSPSCSQQSSTCSMSAMSASEQPAAMVGQDHRHALAVAAGQPLRPIGQDVGRLGHEMDAAKGDRPALLVRRGQLGQLVAVAAEVRQGDHLVLLIVMAEDQQPRAHLRPHLLDARGEHVVFQRLVGGQLESRGGTGGNVHRFSFC